jgi:hypothetical protein
LTCKSEHERYLTEKYAKKPVVVMNYPKAIKAFYMRLNDDGRTVAAVDVLAPGAPSLTPPASPMCATPSPSRAPPATRGVDATKLVVAVRRLIPEYTPTVDFLKIRFDFSFATEVGNYLLARPKHIRVIDDDVPTNTYLILK